MTRRSDTGIALVSTLMVMMLVSALLVGFTTMLTSDNRLTSLDRGRSEAFYATHGGVEMLTSDLAELFMRDFSPSGDEVRALANPAPSVPGVTFTAADGSSGYRITFDSTTGDPATGDPVAVNRSIGAGPFQGMTGLVTEYNLDVTGHLYDGSESNLQRRLQTVAIPAFQFGVFSDPPLSLFPGPVFDFGGRLHVNDDFFIAASGGVVLSERSTVLGEVIRTHLSNGEETTNRLGPVDIATAPGVFRDLDRSEGSLIGTVGSSPNEPMWTNLSTGTYNSYITTHRTGARRLDLPIISDGGTPIDLIRRPSPAESPTSPILEQRYFTTASVRILLSDTAAEITSMPSVTGDPPFPLGGLIIPGGGNVTICHINGGGGGVTITVAVPAIINAHVLVHGDALGPCGGGFGGVGEPLAISNGNPPEGYTAPLGSGLIDGFVKVEVQTSPGTWQDVTLDVINLGFSGRNLDPVAGCVAEPRPNAVLRFQRVKENNVQNPPCGIGSTTGTDYWPNVLYDTREGNLRDNIPTGQATMFLGGVMHYVELDMTNLSRWLQGAIGVSGTGAMSDNGYVVYFSDRRNNKDLTLTETGDYGFEDFVNPASGAGTPNGVPDLGEDLNGNGFHDTYGQFPAGFLGAAPLDNTARPTTLVTAPLAKANRTILFRRALKLTNGNLGSFVMPGVTVTAENPVYIQGDYNAGGGAAFGEPNAATAVIADAVTLLSNSWDDWTSIQFPHDPNSRPATTTWYRTAIISGKGLSFPRPSPGDAQDFGTDGGLHNFLRFLESWGGQTLNYRGSLISLAYNQQGIGTFKCCTNVYSPPVRAFAFDVDFLDSNLLPPGTPAFRDINILGFTQVIRPQ